MPSHKLTCLYREDGSFLKPETPLSAVVCEASRTTRNVSLQLTPPRNPLPQTSDCLQLKITPAECSPSFALSHSNAILSQKPLSVGGRLSHYAGDLTVAQTQTRIYLFIFTSTAAAAAGEHLLLACKNSRRLENKKKRRTKEDVSL